MARLDWLTPYFLVLATGCATAGLVLTADPRPADRDTAPSGARFIDQPAKARLLVLTDMTSIEPGVLEPDDAQSMIRLMLYANEFDIEGLIASSGLQHDHIVRPWIIHQIVDAYAQCRPNLLLHDDGYPPAEQLRRTIKSGQPRAGTNMPFYEIIGEDKDTEASEWIIRMVDKPDERPLWIVIWGGSADLAQALWKVRHTRSPEAVTAFISRIRVAASVDQDTTGPWIKSRFPKLFYATRNYGGRGMYRGGDAALVSSSWVQKNIKGHGALGQLYPDYRGGDIWWDELGEVRGIKGGDSATYMGLIPNGLNVRNRLTWANWGGRIEPEAETPQHFQDAVDRIGSYQTDVSPYLASVYQWRPHFQPAYAARFDWCIKPYDQANHAPRHDHGFTVIEQHVVSGATVALDGSGWHDPDGDELTYHWRVLGEESTYRGRVHIKNDSTSAAQFMAPLVRQPQSIHMLLTVRDNGTPTLTAYKRYHFVVHP